MTSAPRPGFALPLALVLMLAGTVLAMSALHVAGSDYEANRAVRLSHGALRAAEAGGYRTVLHWDATGAGGLAPGDSVDTGWQTLPGGATYRTAILRVDGGAASARFRLRTVGRPDGGSGAQRVVYTMVEGGGGGGAVAVGGAVMARGRLQVRGGGPWGGQVDGADRRPPGWDAFCTAALDDAAGVRIEDQDDLQLQAGGDVDGDPDVLEDGSIGGADFLTIGDRSYADLAADADIRYSGNTTINSAVGPRVSGGACDTSDPSNWGDPTFGSICGDYLPVIHVSGNLNLNSIGVGQGILLVDGNLRIDAPFSFTGLVVVLGTVDLRSMSSITGGLMVRGNANGNGQSDIRGPARVLYSACALSRVAGGSPGPRFMAGRHWFDIQ